jgi:hypothetical protein
VTSYQYTATIWYEIGREGTHVQFDDERPGTAPIDLDVRTGYDLKRVLEQFRPYRINVLLFGGNGEFAQQSYQITVDQIASWYPGVTPVRTPTETEFHVGDAIPRFHRDQAHRDQAVPAPLPPPTPDAGPGSAWSDIEL